MNVILYIGMTKGNKYISKSITKEVEHAKITQDIPKNSKILTSFALTWTT